MKNTCMCKYAIVFYFYPVTIKFTKLYRFYILQLWKIAILFSFFYILQGWKFARFCVIILSFITGAENEILYVKICYAEEA